MILVDYNNVAVASIMAQYSQMGGNLEEGLIRHIIFNSLLSFRKRYPKDKYGEMVICCDGGNYWRRDIYPYYKIGRKKEVAEEGGFDWEELFRIMNLIREELDSFMPYKVLRIYKVEGDDIIAVLAKTFPGPHVVVSNDKDFGQLQKIDNLIQYAPLKNQEVKINNPDEFLKEHIIRGDGGDGVPNILSDDDVFANPEKRQKSIFAKKLPKYLSEELSVNFDSEKILRNQMMIDLDNIPSEFVEKIREQFASKNDKKIVAQDIFKYFLSKKLSKLMEDIASFI